MTTQQTQEKLQKVVQKIAKEFKPEKIILFGSWAWGKPGKDSDFDLFIVKKTRRSTREVAREIDGSLWGRTIPLDIIVYTPENVEKRLKTNDFFIRDIINKGKILHESK